MSPIGELALMRAIVLVPEPSVALQLFTIDARGRAVAAYRQSVRQTAEATIRAGSDPLLEGMG
jgi:hypothetical protein